MSGTGPITSTNKVVVVTAIVAATAVVLTSGVSLIRPATGCNHKCPKCSATCGKEANHAQNGATNAEKKHACPDCGRTW